MRKWRIIIFVVAVLLVHIALVFRMVPPRFLISGELPALVDVSRYFGSAHSAMMAGGMAGYDPTVNAGYVAGGWNSMGKKGYEMAHWLLPAVPLPVLLSWILVVTSLLAPLLLWWAVIRINGGGSGYILPLIVSVVYWHLETQTNTFLQCGNVGFPLGAVLITVAAAVCDGLFNGRNKLGWGIGLGFVVVVVFYVHTVLMVPLMICCLAFSLLNLQAFKKPMVWGGLTVAGAISCVLIVPWLRVLINTLPSCQTQVFEVFSGSFKYLVMDMFSDRVFRMHFDRNFLLQAAVLGGATGTWLAAYSGKSRSRGLLACGGAAAVCIVMAYWASVIPALRSWQPYRFLVPAMFLLLPALCCAIAEAGTVLSGAGKPVRLVVLAVGLLVLPRFTGYLIDLTVPLRSAELPGDEVKMMHRLAGMDFKGRVLCDDAQLGHLIPYYSGKAVLGGLSVMTFVKEGFAGVDDKGRFFGRTADDWRDGELDRYLDSYAVEYMIVRLPEWVALAEKHPDRLIREETIGPYHVFRVKTWTGYALNGSAVVSVDFRGISVSGMKGRECVLKFHYSSAMEAPRGATLDRVPELDDPVGFVRLTVPDGWTQCRITFRAL